MPFRCTSSSFSTFEELTDVIVGVALVRPRPGVFVDSISHLLILSTPSQVHLVGLGYAPPSPGAKKDVTFYLTGLSVPTDGISFTTIRGTSNGRIFLSSSPEPLTPGGIGGDGCLYELAYQSSEGWFAKRCTLHNLTSGSIVKSVVPSFLRSLSAIPTQEWIVALEIDTERGLLYTLLRNSTIEMYSLPSSSPGKGVDGAPTKVAKSGDVVRTANMLLPNNPMIKNFRIVEMEVISVKEGGNSKIGLVAVTSTGELFGFFFALTAYQTEHLLHRCSIILHSSKTRVLLRIIDSCSTRTLSCSTSPFPFDESTSSPIDHVRSNRSTSTATTAATVERKSDPFQFDHPSEILFRRTTSRSKQPHSRSRRPPRSCSRCLVLDQINRRRRSFSRNFTRDSTIRRGCLDYRNSWSNLGYGRNYRSTCSKRGWRNGIE